MIGFNIRKNISTLNLFGSEEIYKLRQMIKKETIVQNIRDFKNQVLGFLIKFYLLVQGKQACIYQGSSKP